LSAFGLERVTVTAERIERAITFTAYCMKRWRMPELLPTLKRLEAERDRLSDEGDALAYADSVLARSTKLIEPRHYLPVPQNLAQSDIKA
jgi:hypothetical protein